jgi:hypothetical protein
LGFQRAEALRGVVTLAQRVQRLCCPEMCTGHATPGHLTTPIDNAAQRQHGHERFCF